LSAGKGGTEKAGRGGNQSGGVVYMAKSPSGKAYTGQDQASGAKGEIK